MTTSAISPFTHVLHPLRLLLVDDMRRVRCDLRQLLELTGLVKVVAEAGDGLEGVLLAGALAPEVVVMDLEMPGLDGCEATRRIKSQAPEMRVIILSVHADAEAMERARAAGADDFVVKGASYETLMQAILGPGISTLAGEVNGHE